MKIQNKNLRLLLFLYPLSFFIFLSTCSKLAPVDSASAQPKCGLCHGAPPAGLAHDNYASGNDCALCHAGNSGLDGFTNAATHDDGTLDLTACNVCHAAPPATGAHAKHVTGYGRDCNVCHEGYSAQGLTALETTHVNGTVESGCSAADCHGSNRVPVEGVTWVNQNVTWGQTLDCKGCHLISDQAHFSKGTLACNRCHYKTMGGNPDSVIANPLYHVNGTADLIN